MNKKPIFREKSKPNSREQNEQPSKENNTFCKPKRHMQTSQLEKETYQKKFICEDCAMLHKHAATKDGDVGHNLLLDKKKLDSDYIDSLVCKIKELKNRVKFFENQYGFETIVGNSVVYHYQSENETIGDYDVSKQHHKRSKNKLGIRFSNDDMQLCGDFDKTYTQFYKRARNFSDRQRSIYTNNDAIIAPSLVQDGYTRISKNQKNKSNASIVMSLNSGNHNDFVKINPHMSSKHFQAAAEEFIEQAEELKSKIGYILECCGYTTPTISNFSESRMPSEFNYNTVNNTTNNTRSIESINDDASSDPHLRVLFETVSSQYKEILDSLMSIESQIKTLHKHKAHPRIPEIQEEPIIINKVHDRKYKSATLPNKKHSPTPPPPPPPNSFPMEAKKYLPDLESKHLKMGICNKVLEPVVMVYEPIHPEPSEGEMFKSAFKDKRDDTKQKYGFVVTYTPDISPESSANVSDGKSSKKNSKKQVKKKRLLPCLGF
ncbi:hypothetical protein ILUMI_11683 [Ignelater luminosus]|uniref:Uncharacterized protein n=1 Tax=Ignelater luminosus TaxID=2038154 RepID=A0A8K0D0Z4_IGNLU|nr:hypothetical protein ILUMI_11683 [Ignelater luminosus]